MFLAPVPPSRRAEVDMHLEEWTLREPAGRAVRVAALELLSRVRANRERLDGSDSDPEALHDFRVSVRRLRSWLRAFDGVLDDTLAEKPQQRLKRIAQATGGSRDLEVHLAWVNERQHVLRGRQRRGAEWLGERLAARKVASDLELKRMVESEFDRATSRIESAMSSFTSSVVDDEPRFAAVAARLVRRHASSLAKALRSVTSIGDRAQAHAARIAAKRLRYLLDPLDGAVAGIETITKELAELQDRFGELHDAQLFGSEIATAVAELLAAHGAASTRSSAAKTSADDPVPGLHAIARRLRRAEETAYAAAEERWLGDTASSLLARVATVAELLDGVAAQGREIRRRYLLTRLPDDMPPAVVSEIELGSCRTADSANGCGASRR